MNPCQKCAHFSQVRFTGIQLCAGTGSTRLLGEAIQAEHCGPQRRYFKPRPVVRRIMRLRRRRPRRIL